MVRFKVIRGSHLLLAISALILAAVVVFILLQAGSNTASVQDTVLQTQSSAGAKAVEAFASAPSLQISVISKETAAPPLADAPSVLIYHTHTHEAYTPDSFSDYEAVETWRTADHRYSVVRVGAALADELTERGFFVVHDTTDHELDNIDLAYVRSLETLESYSMEFDLVIDLHRDAYSEGLKESLISEGASYAQVMLLVGNGGDYTGKEAPDYEKNLAFAQSLTLEMNKLRDGIARNVTIKKGRYNQHIGKLSALIEVGHNLNTLKEALASVPVIADSIGYLLK